MVHWLLNPLLLMSKVVIIVTTHYSLCTLYKNP